MGRRAAERVLERVGGSAGAVETILLPTELIVRESTDDRARETAPPAEPAIREMGPFGARS
jgi:hypothetical protein